VTNQAATFARDTGTSGIVESARAAVSTLAEHDIPHLIVGGLAVQEHGYPRVTIDVDIVCPRCWRRWNFSRPALPGRFIVCTELMIAWKTGGMGCKLICCRREGFETRLQSAVPTAHHRGRTISNRKLEELIALKLDSWAGSPVRRHKTKPMSSSDQIRKLPATSP